MPYRDPERTREYQREYQRERWRSKKQREYQAGRYRKRVAEALELKGGACQACGIAASETQIHFHHVDPGTKEFEVTTGWSRRRDLWLLELQKTVLLCEECHAQVHFGSEAPTEMADRLRMLKKEAQRQARYVDARMEARERVIEHAKRVTRESGASPYHRRLRGLLSARRAEWILEERRAAEREARELTGPVFAGEAAGMTGVPPRPERRSVEADLARRLAEDRLAVGPGVDLEAEWEAEARAGLRAARKKRKRT